MVLVEHPRPHVALVTLNRPERMNSMAFDVMVPFKEVLENITYDNSVRVVVLTGAGKGFSSGADHKSAGSVPHVQDLTRPTYALRSMAILDDVILALRTAAPAGDRRGQWRRDRRWAVPGTGRRHPRCGARSVFPGRGHQQRADRQRAGVELPAAAGHRFVAGVRDHADRSRRRTPRRPSASVLVSRQVPENELLETCYDMAERIAAFSRPGVELTKRTLWSGPGRR